MGTVIEDAAKASAWIATALSSSGYIADFSPASLWQIDRFFDEQAQGGTAKPGGLLSQDLGSRLFAVGAKDKEARRSLPDGFGDPGIVLYPIPPPIPPDLVSEMFDT